MKKIVFISAMFLLAASGAGAQATTMTPAKEGKTLSLNAFGYNTQSIKGPGWDRQPFLDRIAELDPGNFRYPGGTVANFWDWRTGYYNEVGLKVNVISTAKDGPFPYMLEDVKKVYDRSRGAAMPIYVVNMLTSTYEEQLAMLKHAQAIGLPVRYIEMGNEYYHDNHPQNYNYLHAFPDPRDYIDSCRKWTAGFHKEFPDARIALIGVANPQTKDDHPRAKTWNDDIVPLIAREGVVCHAVTIHIYPGYTDDKAPIANMIATVVRMSTSDFVQNASIPDKYKLWITEFNFSSTGNKAPGTWAHGISNALCAARFMMVPQVEMICFFNLTSGLQAAAIFEADTKFKDGSVAPKYSLSASGEALKMVSMAQMGATSMREVSFGDNPVIEPSKGNKYNSLYGYVFGGKTPSALLFNVSGQPRTVDITALGFAPAAATQLSSPSLATSVAGPGSLVHASVKTTKMTTLALPAYSMTVLK